VILPILTHCVHRTFPFIKFRYYKYSLLITLIDMKLTYLILFTLILQNLSAQSIFPYEQKIIPTKDLIFEEISFINPEASIRLSGTLIYPKDGYQKIIMIVPGSGKDTRHSHFQLVESFLQNIVRLGINQTWPRNKLEY